MFSIGLPSSLTAPPVKVEPKKPRHVTYSDFIKKIKNNEVDQVVMKPNQNYGVILEKDGSVSDAQVIQNQELWKILTHTEADVQIDMATPPDYSLLFLPIFLYLFFRMFLSVNGGNAVPQIFQPTEFRMDKEINTRFSDVEGIDNAKDELEEIVDFLKNPDQYVGTGAKIPKGAILMGLPGTGKTLLARAIAGESSVPFIACSGSSFVEMFVGMGAKRARDLFSLARANQPCIVFIDEIDAIGKKRSGSAFGANDEREQTINQLLTEMDGFENDTQIVVLAATNRIDILDDALLRPGRFDRKIQVSLPNIDGRERILGVHARDKKFDQNVSLRNVAMQTTGFSGADLANLLNECAIRAVRDGNNGIINNEIIENVFQRIVVGAKGSTKFSPQKKELVAYHEAGHAIVGALAREYDLVRKVSIIPRGDAGGITFFQPNEEVDLQPKSYYLARLRVVLGGRAAEQVVYGKDEVTTGASSDYMHAYKLAREMVTIYGFGENNFDYNNLSPFSSRVVDKEIEKLVKKCYEESVEILTMRRAELEFLKNKLVAEEIVDGQWVYDELFCGNQENGCQNIIVIDEVSS